MAEAAAQSLASPAPRRSQLAALFGLGALVAAGIAAALWFGGFLEPAPRETGPVPAVVAPAAPPSESSPLFDGEPLPLRADDTLSAARPGR